MKCLKFLIFLFFFSLHPALAEVKLVIWSPPKFDFSFAIPVKEGQSNEEALASYLNALKKNPELLPYFNSLQKNAAQGTFKDFIPGAEPSAFAIANDAEDFAAKPDRMHKVLDPLSERGAKPFLIPVAATAPLNAAEKLEFQALLNQNADLLIAVGGDDIHPDLYKRPMRHSVNTNLSRDKEELGMVKSYLEKGRGFFYGVCRGHQMAGVAAGCTLTSDIEKELNISYPRNIVRPIKAEGAPSGITKEILGNTKTIDVFSNHHQAVDAGKKAAVKVTAVAADVNVPIVQMAEYYDGRGIGVQYHPEEMPSSALHARLYDALYGEAQKAKELRLAPKTSRIDLATTLFGVEYTFQDQAMVDEPGRMTMSTPHKQKKLNTFRSAYVEELGLDANSIEVKSGFKEGNFINVPGDGKHVMNMEPVTIEVNTTPKLFDQIEAAATPIFKASEAANLKPYMNPAAERSGMGHIHVGGRTLAESPFYKNPNLLRNMMVYYHKHPSLLWGFGEAYDIGNKSNIETFHDPKKQAAFERAVKKYDAWYKKTSEKGGDLSDGLRQFLLALKSEQGSVPGLDFFHHYRAINLEHLVAFRDGRMDINTPGKATVEFRGFRPPKSPQHAKADADLLVNLMELQSEPGRLESFSNISPDAYDRFHTSSKVAADWELVKKELPSKNPLWDEMLTEYVDVQHKAQILRVSLGGKRDLEVYPSFSEKGNKGSYFEVRIPVNGNKTKPKIAFEGAPLDFEKVKVGKEEFWVSLVKSKTAAEGPALRANLSNPDFCRTQFGLFR